VKISPPKVIVAYTLSPWEHALALLRIEGPIQTAGLEMVRGNLYQDISIDKADQADLIVIQRDFPKYTEAYEGILERAKTNGIPIVLDLDDLILELPENHPDRGTHYYTEALFPILRTIIEVNAVTASTQPLCDYITKINSNVWLLPNYLNDHVWQFENIHEKQESGKVPIIIGYMGGDSHAPDLDEVTPALVNVCQKFGEVINFHFFGLKPPQLLLNQPNVEWKPMNIMDYSEFVKFFQEQNFDIFIAPLADNLFNRCKSPIKYLEYSTFGLPGVYSDIPPYASIIKDGENGFLASSTSEWVNCLIRLIQDPTLRNQVGIKAHETVRENWLLSQNANKWAEAYTNIISGMDRVDPPLSNQNLVIVEMAKQVQKWQRTLQAQSETEKHKDEELRRQLALKDAEIHSLSEQISAINNSIAWKAVCGFRAMLLKLAPPASRRGRLLQHVRTFLLDQENQ
jgi:glycosyltransferase involved in cell wall biosynthesis